MIYKILIPYNTLHHLNKMQHITRMFGHSDRGLTEQICDLNTEIANFRMTRLRVERKCRQLESDNKSLLADVCAYMTTSNIQSGIITRNNERMKQQDAEIAALRKALAAATTNVS